MLDVGMVGKERLMTNKPPTHLGIDPSNPNRCFITPPIDIPYMQEQRQLLQELVANEGNMTHDESEKIKNIIGFLDHFIAGIYFVAAEYSTVNRVRY